MLSSHSDWHFGGARSMVDLLSLAHASAAVNYSSVYGCMFDIDPWALWQHYCYQQATTKDNAQQVLDLLECRR
jgi:hypothetical protein